MPMLGNSCAAFKELESRRTSVIPSTFIEVGELTTNEVATIVDSWLAHDRKKLQTFQRQHLDATANMGLNPLFLRLLYLYSYSFTWQCLFTQIDTIERQNGGLSRRRNPLRIQFLILLTYF